MSDHDNAANAANVLARTRRRSNGDMVVPSATPAENDTERSGIALTETLGRRWLLVLCLWLVIGGGLSAFIWTYFETQYEAVGLVRIAPSISRIVFRDEDNNLLPYYGAFVKTQMQLITNREVLSHAVERPELASLAWHPPGVDPVEWLGEQLVVDNPESTELVSLAFQGPDPNVVAPVVNAVVQAYMNKVREQDESADLEKLELLYRKQADLEAELARRHDELYELASKFGTYSLGDQQDSAAASTQQLQIELKRAQAERIAAQTRLEAIRKAAPAPLSADELERLRAELTMNDPDLSSLIYAKTIDEQMLLQASQRLGPQHRELRSARQRLESIEERLSERQAELNRSFDTIARDRARTTHEAKLLEAEQSYLAAVQQEEALHELVEEDLAAMTRMGRDAVKLQALREKSDQTKQLYDAVLGRIQHLEMEKARPARVSVDALATTPTSPARDKRIKLTILAVAMGLFVSMLTAVIVDARDTSVRSGDEVRRDLGLNLLGTRTFPNARTLADRAMLATVAEEIRNIRGCVLFAGGCSETQSLLITSPNPKEGKTRMAADLAVALAESGRRVLLIDADNRKRDLTRLFGADGRPGLCDVLTDAASAEAFVCATSTPGLSFLPAGNGCEQFSEWLVHPGNIERVREVFSRYDHVIVDAPPVLLSNEPAVWARHLDSVLMVVRAKYSARGDAILAKDRLTQMGGRIVGAVLNGAEVRSSYYRQYEYANEI